MTPWRIFFGLTACRTCVSRLISSRAAPDNVEDPLTPPPVPPQLVPICADKAIDDIAAELSASDTPNLVIMVHGFNNPPPAVFKFYTSAAAAIDRDACIIRRKGLVCVGYRRIVEEDTKHHRANRDAKRVQLSFIGHSMGGYVVTNAIRVLSDVFDISAMQPRLNAGLINEQNAARFTGEEGAPDLSPHLGHAFNLMRFVLASPDIPAEALISNRANFLASSLRRFREAYLFSNQGDEVLRQISTVANYFSFPTKSWKFGFRLGNVEILSSGYGIIPVARPAILATLRIGYYTLQQIYDRLRITRAEDAETLQNKLPERFSYFDCTDYVDTDNNGVRRPLLTFALRLKRDNPQARMSWRQHLCLLESYVRNGKPDVHAGYFEGLLSQQIIYRLASLGYHDTVVAYGGRPQLSDACREKQIRVLLSPGL